MQRHTDQQLTTRVARQELDNLIINLATLRTELLASGELDAEYTAPAVFSRLDAALHQLKEAGDLLHRHNVETVNKELSR